MTKINIIGQSREALTSQFAELGLPAFRVQQVWNWLYHHGLRSFDAMNNISAQGREALHQGTDLPRAGCVLDLQGNRLCQAGAHHAALRRLGARHGWLPG